MSQPSEETRSVATVTIHTVIWVLMTILPLTGNSLICLALYRNRRLRTITNFYVLALAITDIICAMFVVPFNTIASGLRKWPFGFNFCQFNGVLSLAWAVVSLNILALTAVNRYFCIVRSQLYPTLFTKKKVVFSIIFVWLFGVTTVSTITLVTPGFYRWHFHYLFCQPASFDFSGVKALVSTSVAVLVVLPMSAILLCYGSVHRAIRRHNSAVIPSMQQANGPETVSVQDIQASRVLLAAVIAFAVCWIPATIIMMLQQVATVNVPSFWQSFHTFSAFCSSWINPVVYGVMSRALRSEFMKLLRCRKEN